MIQAVITPEHRGELGMHYTSVPNIMKVIEPLFLDELREEFARAVETRSIASLQKLLKRIWKIKIFDPACGSGNFLIIAYKELRKLEMLIFKEIDLLKGRLGSTKIDFEDITFSQINLSNFYGIELDDFAHEVAILSLWLAEHQMNQEFMREFGRCKPALPLQETGNIVNGNACRIDWEMVCPKNEGDEIYILGNPPYLGSKNLSDVQRDDMYNVFGNRGKTLDFIAAWFNLASKYSIKSNTKFAFVTTNSICQGEQVNALWPDVLNDKLEIFFAHQSFKWQNNAKNQAAVTVAIVGLRHKNNTPKRIYKDDLFQITNYINPYLLPTRTIYIESRNQPLGILPDMIGGNVAYDSGNFIFEESEMNSFIRLAPESRYFFQKIMGGKELLNGGIRYCLWMKDFELSELVQIPLIKERIEKVKLARLAAKDEGTHKLAERPHQFRDLNNPDSYIAIPKTSSERRFYIPVNYLDKNHIPADSIRIIPNAEVFVFGIISSRMHMNWMKVVSGRLKTDFRYSKNLTYNTFPFPPISDKQKKELEQHVYNILGEREKHSEKTLAQLYDPDKMPDGLREAHRQNDLAVERCYRSRPFESDEERLEFLFKLYEQMIEEEKERGTLFAGEKKSKKKK
jgi:hypothetical protein